MAEKKKAPKNDGGADEWVPLRVPRSIRKRVRQAAADEEKSLQRMTKELLEEALRQRGA